MLNLVKVLKLVSFLVLSSFLSLSTTWADVLCEFKNKPTAATLKVEYKDKKTHSHLFAPC